MTDRNKLDGPGYDAPPSVTTRPESSGPGGSDKKPSSRRGKRVLILAIASLLVIALVGGVVLTSQALNDPDELTNPPPITGTQNPDAGSQGELAVPTRAGGQEVHDPDGGGVHIQVGSAHAAYRSTPATSGPHWSTRPTSAAPSGAPARWGTYTEVLPDEVLVHNLEHGGIGLHYDCPSGCPDIVTALQKIVPSNPSLFVLSPYRGIPAPYTVAITAWRYHLFLESVDLAIIAKFIDEHQDNAPESVPGNMF